jgi:hypothetical protein
MWIRAKTFGKGFYVSEDQYHPACEESYIKRQGKITCEFYRSFKGGLRAGRRHIFVKKGSGQGRHVDTGAAKS